VGRGSGSDKEAWSSEGKQDQNQKEQKMSDASFTKEQELQAYGGKFEYDVSVPLKVVVDFSEANMHWKDALREEVYKKIIEHIDRVDDFEFEFTGPDFSE
jgi:hypothetical protein